jgi:type I restriction enzyme, R subunit
MSPKGYSEDDLVERPAVELLEYLGWETVDAYGEFDHGESTLGRTHKGEVFLLDRLKVKLQQLNPDAHDEAIDTAIELLTKDRSRMSLTAANREVYQLLKDAARVSIITEDEGEQVEVIRFIDWENPNANDYVICSQLWITGEMHTRRPDLIGFVNGIPLVLMELKAPHVNVAGAYSQNLSDYKDTIPQLFWPNALVILSNGSDSRVGSVSAQYEHFADWKKIGSENEAGKVSLETMLKGICTPHRLLDIIENFTLFQDVPGGLIKLVSKNHQYLGVNNAIEALLEIRNREGKLGVFWHTQGSGKSVSMMFFAQKVLRKIPGNWTFVIVTDRKELDGQIYKNFVTAGVVTESKAQAESTQHLRQLLKEDHRYVFTLIHKFRTEDGSTHPVLSDRKNIIVITDEAHRSQYDTLAMNMRTALPNAAFLAFTGTPLIAGEEEKTREVFGDYVSIYSFKQSVDDGATVPLYYENRIPELQLVNENLNEDMEQLLEDAELDDAQEKKIEREFAREYHLITRDERLETIAADLVDHFTGRGFRGKAMMICIDKATAVRMYDKVQAVWKNRIEKLIEQLSTTDPDQQASIHLKIRWMQETDMAVVVSQGQNEIADLEAKGLDIRPHRKRMIEEDLETKFKQPDDPFRLVFVCAMWITGFDVPSCSTLYLDKPMRNHTLMQTIARANRVYPGKLNGLIVDYVGVFRNLEQALKVYGKGGKPGEKPIEDKSALIAALQHEIAEIRSFLQSNKIDLTSIQTASGFDKISLIDEAVEALLICEDTKREYLDAANRISRIYKAILPDDTARQFAADAHPIQFIAKKIHDLNPPADISSVMQQIEDLLNLSVGTEGYVITAPDAGTDEGQYIDLSAIDFDALAEKFKIGKKRTINEKLQSAVSRKVMKMVKLNRTRINYLERFQELIEKYNSGSMNAEQFFNELKDFAKDLSSEEKRTVTEQLTDEELALFDLLTKPDIELTASERRKVKATARSLLQTLKEKNLVIDWRKRQQSRAQVRVTIEVELDKGLPRAYTPELFKAKTEALFQHFYDSYQDASNNIYTAA